MVGRIDRRRPASKVSSKSKPGKTGSSAPSAQIGRGFGGGSVDRFAGIGRIIGGSSDFSVGPGARPMMPLTQWERWDIDHDNMFAEARERIAAYKNLPDKWKREVDKWGKRASKDMAYSISKAIMKS